MDHQIEIRVQDYRTIEDPPFDLVAAVGILEHVGSDLPNYPATMHRLLKPGGRFFHHAISRPPVKRERFPKPTFINSYVFPDADLHEIGRIVSAFQEANFEVRHVETLRDHYIVTLNVWADRLQRNWDDTVRLLGAGRARGVAALHQRRDPGVRGEPAADPPRAVGQARQRTQRDDARPRRLVTPRLRGLTAPPDSAQSDSVMVTELITTSSFGRSPPPVGTDCIASTTSSPFTTLPKREY